jgi:hypothetical protein
MSRGTGNIALTKPLLLILASFSATGAAAAELPEGAVAALKRYCALPAGREAEWLKAHKVQAVDLTGDGQPEYIVELNRMHVEALNGDTCANAVIGQQSGGFDEVASFNCCAQSISGGRIECTDFHQKRVALSYSGGKWIPARKDKTVADAKRKYQDGTQLLRQKKLEEAKNALCTDAQPICGVDPQQKTACALAMLSLHENGPEAEQVLRDAVAGDPSYALAYSTWASLDEQRKDWSGAIAHYQKYLAVKPDAKDRAEIEARISKLKSGATETADGELPVVAAGNCRAICEKLSQCKLGLSSVDDCVGACQSAEGDARTSKTYACSAKATSCGAMKACAK